MATGPAGGIRQFLSSLAVTARDRHRPDSELLRRFAAERDQAAFAALVQRHGPMVLCVCRRVLGSWNDAEDAFLATFLVLARKAGTSAWRHSVANWLHEVAYRLARKAQAQAAGRAARERRAPARESIEAGPDVTWRELQAVLDEELARLPQNYRAPLVLCCLEGATRDAAARRLGWPLGTLNKRLQRGRAVLQGRLTRRGLALSAAIFAPLLAQGGARAAVPAALARSTVLAADGFAAGTALRAGLVSARAVALATGGIQSMTTVKIKGVAVLLLLAGLALGWGAVTYGLAARREPPPDRPAYAARAAADEPPKEAERTNEVGVPTGWFGGSANGDAYEAGTDRKVFHGGKASAYVRMKGAGDDDFGTLGQAIAAKAYRGKRLRLAGFVKTDGAAGGAALWMRVDGKGATLAFDNMNDRRLKGSKDWTKCEVVLDVPEKATAITFGLLLSGNGKAWLDDVTLEAVGKDVKVTNMLDKELPSEADEGDFPEKPTNLDFEAGRGGGAAPAPAEPLTREQKDWLKKNALPFDTAEPGRGFADLKPLRTLVGGTRIVALGEATHGTRECFTMKHRLTEFLANEMGFTHFAIEANMPEAYRVNQYVRTGRGDPKELLRGMYFWTWDTQEVLDMIEWMRAFNASGKGKMQFLGFDMQFGRVAMDNVRAFVKKADPGYADELEKAYDGLGDYWGSAEKMRAARALSREEKEKRAARALDVVKHLEAGREGYLKTASAEDVDRATQDARVAWQAVREAAGGTAHRDECMADNVAWILDHAPKGSKVVLWAHNGHVARRPGWMGSYLAKRYGREMVVVGFAIHEGRYTAVGKGGLTDGNEAKPPPPGSVEWHFHETGLPRFMLDVRGAKDSAGSWLARPRPFRSIGALAMEQQFYPTTVADDYDVLIYFDKTAPSACFRLGQ
jgi:erythromycin esterase